jgi:hypothetical protein
LEYDTLLRLFSFMRHDIMIMTMPEYIDTPAQRQ